MARTLVHIVRVRGGVTHIDASPGVSATDAAELERLPLGSLAAPRAIARLAAVPSVFGRRLRSGRFAITRILPAAPGDGGPEAVDAVSLVMPARGYAQAAGSLAEIALDERFWKIARMAVAGGFDIPEATSSTPAADPRALRALDAWLVARQKQGVAVLPPEDAMGILAMVSWLDPEDCPDCRWGIGVLTLEAPVDVCTISPIAGIVSSRPLVQAAVGDAWLSPAMQHVVWHLAGNARLPRLRSLVSSVRIETARDRAAAPAASSPIAVSGEAPSRQAILLGVIAGCVLLLTAAILIRALGSDESVVDSDEGSRRPRERLGAGSDDAGIRPVPVRPPAVDSLSRPMAAAEDPDLDGDGVPNGADCEMRDPTLGLMQVFYRDFDGDGAGDPNPLLAMRACVPPGSVAPDGYSRSSDDICDQNPALTSNGGCPCHWLGSTADLDGNGVLDCLDDVDHDGIRLADDPVDDRYRLCSEAAEYFNRARREIAHATILLDEVDERARFIARDKNLKGEALRHQERLIIEPHLMAAKDAIRAGLWEVYAARRTVVFGDESFTPRSQADPRQPAPDIFPVATDEQFALLRMFIEEQSRVTTRYARAYARYIHLGRPQRLIREELLNEILAKWTAGTVATTDSLESMRWVAGLVTSEDDELDYEIRRIDEQLMKGRHRRRSE